MSSSAARCLSSSAALNPPKKELYSFFAASLSHRAYLSVVVSVEAEVGAVGVAGVAVLAGGGLDGRDLHSCSNGRNC